MFQFMMESATLCGARMTFGDEYVADQIFDQEYDAEFVGRHTHQLSSLYEEKFFPDDD